MKTITGDGFDELKPFFEAAAKVAANSTCQRDHCGAVVAKDGQIIGEGFNSPPANDESQRSCNAEYDYSRKPKSDKTCCVHAEWRAILDAAKHHANKIKGSTLYFMRLNEEGQNTTAGQLYCTVCSRLILDSGIGYFALWNGDGAKVYDAAEANKLSYGFFRK